MNIIDIEINYQIYQNGKIWSDKADRYLKLQTCKLGYKRVALVVNGKRSMFSVHRLVAFKYLKNDKNLSDVNHIDGIKSNNNADNLEWVTHAENMKHSVNVLKNKHGRIQKKLRNEMVYYLCKEYKHEQVASLIGTSLDHIGMIVHRYRKYNK